MEKLFNFDFQGEKLTAFAAQYDNGAPAILIKTDSEPYCTLTVNLVSVGLATKNHYYIKSWGENEEIANFLRNSEFFEDTGQRIPTGFVQAEVWKRR